MISETDDMQAEVDTELDAEVVEQDKSKPAPVLGCMMTFGAVLGGIFAVFLVLAAILLAVGGGTFILVSIAMQVATAMAILMVTKRIGYHHKGQWQAKLARERGDVVVAELYNRDWHYRDYRGGTKDDRIDSRDWYSYNIDGKSHRFYIDNMPNAPKTIEVCYDRYHGNRYIDPDKRGVLDGVLFLAPFAVLAICIYFFCVA